MAELNHNSKGYEDCSGCACCHLPCPVWRRTRDVSLTPHGRARALQWGAAPDEIAEGVEACLLCGACEPFCPEGRDITAEVLKFRKELIASGERAPAWHPRSLPVKPNVNRGVMHKPTIVLPGDLLAGDDKGCREIIRILGGAEKAAIALYDGREIAAALEAGLTVAEEKIERFLLPLRSARRLVVADGGFIRHLKGWLPGKRIIGLGEAILASPAVREKLSPNDLYIIENRSYHEDYNRLVHFYNNIINSTGMQTNLDLNRLAIATGASSLQGRYDMKAAGCFEQAEWIIRGKTFKRIVVEDMADMPLMKKRCNLPVVHISRIASEGRQL